jgi:hypothetical protein
MNDLNSWNRGYYKAALENGDYKVYASLLVMIQVMDLFNESVGRSGLRNFRIGSHHADEIAKFYVQRIHSVDVHLVNHQYDLPYYAGYYEGLKDVNHISNAEALTIEERMFNDEKTILYRNILAQVSRSYNPNATKEGTVSFSEATDELLMFFDKTKYSPVSFKYID